MMNLSKDDLKYGKGIQVKLMGEIFNNLSDRYTQHLPTKELKLHISWTCAKQLGELLKPKSLYGIPIVIHRENDPDMKVDWEFR